MPKHTEPIVVKQELKTSLHEAWRTITDLYEMRNWYFYLDDFKPDIGFSFHFIGTDGETEYVHLAKVTQVEDGKLLAHSWKFKDYAGDSEVSFELSREKDKTYVTLMHKGVESFAGNGKSFSRESFQKGWEAIMNKLSEYIINR